MGIRHLERSTTAGGESGREGEDHPSDVPAQQESDPVARSRHGSLRRSDRRCRTVAKRTRPMQSFRNWVIAVVEERLSTQLSCGRIENLRYTRLESLSGLGLPGPVQLPVLNCSFSFVRSSRCSTASLFKPLISP